MNLNKCLPNSEVYKVTNFGHTWPLESPGLFSSVVRAWINDKPSPGEVREVIILNLLKQK